MELRGGQKIYFLSDFHLGVPDAVASRAREMKLIRFLDKASRDAAMIFIVGDLFDFWFEYKKVVPKGYVRILGKMAEITDAGIPIHFFVGNHDMWMNGYFEEELNIPVFHEPQEYVFSGKSFLIGHGDGLGPGDHGYKMLKKIFRNPVCQFLFGIIPPYIGMNLAHWSSRGSRSMTGNSDDKFLGEEKEWLIVYCKEVLKQRHFDYFIFGHRHLPIHHALSANSSYINLGDWIRYDTYAEFDGVNLELKNYEDN